MPRPLIATIDISAMHHNLTLATRRAAGAKVWAVVKANAYGHGLLRSMRGFASADGLTLIEFDHAQSLREAGWTKPVLMLEGCFDMGDVLSAAIHQLQIVVHCNEQIVMLEHAVRERLIDVRLDIWLKLNSGMNRLGFVPDAFQAAYRRLQALQVVRSISLMTHFANADVPDNAALPLVRQVGCFEASATGLAGDRSLANSVTALQHPALAADWIRPGIMLYGGSPGNGRAAHFGLEPAMTLSSELIGVQDISTGAAVGYGSCFIAERPMRVGIVACGYADGYPRHAPDGTPVVVDGIRSRLIGRVSMDMLMVDLTAVPAARVGTPVELWGRALPIDEVADHAGTIGYELMCALAPRVRIMEESGHG